MNSIIITMVPAAIVIFLGISTTLASSAVVNPERPLFEVIYPKSPEESSSSSSSTLLSPGQDIQINLANVQQIPQCNHQRCIILSCSSNQPFEWLIEDTAETHLASQIFISERIDSGTYNGQMTILNPKPEYTGWYTCRNLFPKIQKSENNEEARHYIFMQGAQQRRLIENSKIKLVKVKPNSAYFFVPCRPDNANQTFLQLFRSGIEIGNEQSSFYDPKRGFNLTDPLPRHGRYYECRIFHSSLNDFLIIHMIPKLQLEHSPQKSTILVDQGEPIHLECKSSDPSMETQVIRGNQVQLTADTISGVTNSYSTQEAKPTEDSGSYLCIVKEINLHELTIHDVQILHKWTVKVIAKPEQIHLNFTSLHNEEFGRALCETGNALIEPKFSECQCIGELACSDIRETLRSAIAENNCEILNSENGICRSEKKDGIVSCASSASGESATTAAAQSQCRIASIDNSGFLVCIADNHQVVVGGDNTGGAARTRSESRQRKKNEYCRMTFMEVSAGAKEPALSTMPNQITERSCYKVGGNISGGTAGHLWANGICEILPEETSIINCTSHRTSFVDGITWLWKIWNINMDLLTFTMGGGGNFTWPETGLTVSILQEAQSDSSTTFSADTFTSSLALRATKPLNGNLTCRASHINDFSYEEIEIPIRINSVIKAEFNAGGGSSEEESISINYNDNGVLNCSVQDTAFPTPRWIWYKKGEGDSYQQINLTESNPTPEFTNLRFINEPRQDKLQFLAFSAEQEGSYRCQVVQKVLEGQPDIFLHKDFAVSGFDWTTRLIIIIVVVSLLGLIAIVLACLYSYRYRIARVRVQALTDKEVYEFINGNVEAINEELDIAEQAHLLPYREEYEFPMEKLKFDKQLGAGAYGTVMKAIADGVSTSEAKTIVAVKTIQPNADILYLKALLTELKIMIHIGKHLNVVSLLGAVTKNIKNREVFLIVEYCRFGNLQQYLYKSRKVFVNQVVDGEIRPEILKNAEHSYKNVPVAAPRTTTSPSGQQVSLNYQNAIAEFSASIPPESTSAETTAGSTSEQPLWRNNVQGDYVDADNMEALNSSQLLSWSFQIANGMEYLAERKVIHGDLATRNILLAEQKIAKVADFGLARQVYKDANYIKKQKCPLPVKWMALESLQAMQFSTKSDVWAYGIVLWEMFTLGDNPYPGMSVDGEFMDKLQKGYRMSQPKNSPNDLYNVMVECWRGDPDDRPSFDNLAVKLGSMLKNTRKDYYQNVERLMEAAKLAKDSTPSSSGQGQAHPVYQNEIPFTGNEI